MDESTEFAGFEDVWFAAAQGSATAPVCDDRHPTPRSLLQLWSQMFIADSGASLGQRYTEQENNFRKTGYMGYVEPKRRS